MNVKEYEEQPYGLGASRRGHKSERENVTLAGGDTAGGDTTRRGYRVNGRGHKRRGQRVNGPGHRVNGRGHRVNGRGHTRRGHRVNVRHLGVGGRKVPARKRSGAGVPRPGRGARGAPGSRHPERDAYQHAPSRRAHWPAPSPAMRARPRHAVLLRPPLAPAPPPVGPPLPAVQVKLSLLRRVKSTPQWEHMEGTGARLFKASGEQGYADSRQARRQQTIQARGSAGWICVQEHAVLHAPTGVEYEKQPYGLGARIRRVRSNGKEFEEQAPE